MIRCFARRAGTLACSPATCSTAPTSGPWSGGELGDAGLDPTQVCNHSFRATGITDYLGNGGELEIAASLAGHASAQTTRLYNRNQERIKPGRGRENSDLVATRATNERNDRSTLEVFRCKPMQTEAKSASSSLLAGVVGAAGRRARAARLVVLFGARALSAVGAS